VWRPLHRPAVLLTLALSLAAAPAWAADPPGPVTVRIDSPATGETVKSKVHLAAIRGSAQSGNGGPVDFDVMLAIDVSHSTRFPSGADVDEDGETGFNPHEELIAPGTFAPDVVCSDPDDSILAAELRRILVLGATGVGKSSFCRFLGERLLSAGREVAVVDADIGQKDIGPPAAVTLGYPRLSTPLEEIRPVRFFFVGATSPAGRLLPLGSTTSTQRIHAAPFSTASRAAIQAPLICPTESTKPT